jgi:hypothetical protein
VIAKVYVINGWSEPELAATCGRIEDLGRIIKGIVESSPDKRVIAIYIEVVRDGR